MHSIEGDQEEASGKIFSATTSMFVYCCTRCVLIKSFSSSAVLGKSSAQEKPLAVCLTPAQATGGKASEQ